MATLEPTFLIGSSSFFQVTRTTIKSGHWICFIFAGNEDYHKVADEFEI